MLNLRASSPSRNQPFSAQIYVTKKRFAKFLALARLFLIPNLKFDPRAELLKYNLKFIRTDRYLARFDCLFSFFWIKSPKFNLKANYETSKSLEIRR